MNEIDTIRSRLNGGELTCEALIDFLFEYLAGELPAAREQQFEAHLAECPSCVAYLQTYRQTTALGRRAYADPNERPPELGSELVRAILAARR